MTQRSGDGLPALNVNYIVWADIVWAYSNTQLTFRSDNLVALAGIARYMKTLLDDTYIAGLWLRHLPGELLWRTEGANSVIYREDEEERHQPIEESYRAPSFSWAPTDKTINPGEAHVARYILVEVCCVYF